MSPPSRAEEGSVGVWGRGWAGGERREGDGKGGAGIELAGDRQPGENATLLSLGSVYWYSIRPDPRLSPLSICPTPSFVGLKSHRRSLVRGVWPNDVAVVDVCL